MNQKIHQVSMAVVFEEIGTSRTVELSTQKGRRQQTGSHMLQILVSRLPSFVMGPWFCVQRKDTVPCMTYLVVKYNELDN